MNALELVRKMFRQNETMFPDPDTLATVVNPFTGDNYVHLDSVSRADWPPRGTVTKLHFQQEAGGRFALCFGFYKGNTWAWIEDEEGATDD